MVYRAVGDVDRALEGIDAADSARVLDVIESFAIECSINKVATSEALAYAVDEAVQVFGGNGYSREFPVERAYRDARITRIYEGTNEINRLIIATRLLKSPELLAARDAPSSASRSSAGFEAEHRLLAAGKRLALAALDAARRAYGATVRDEQEVLAHAANIVIDVYAAESAVGRAGRLATASNRNAVLAADAARIYMSDAVDRMAHAGRQIVNAIAACGPRPDDVAAAITELAGHGGMDTVGARRRLGDAALADGRYLWP
jgi:alkylation response protein AidB-like acyl-CoA dehydrogenase